MPIWVRRVSVSSNVSVPDALVVADNSNGDMDNAMVADTESDSLTLPAVTRREWDFCCVHVA